MSRGSCCRIAQLDVSSRHVPPLHSAFALRSTRWRVGPGCLVCPSRRFGPLCRLARVPSRPRRGASGPLAVSPACHLALGATLRAPRCLFPAAGCTSGLPCGCALISHARRSPMSHVIPLHIFQTLKSTRWNCNVSGPSRKMTELNYVRLLEGWLPPSLSGPSFGRWHRCQARPFTGPPLCAPRDAAEAEPRRVPPLLRVCSRGGRATSAQASSRRMLSSSTSP